MDLLKKGGYRFGRARQNRSGKCRSGSRVKDGCEDILVSG